MATSRDYNKLAEILAEGCREAQDGGDLTAAGAIEVIAERVAEWFAQDNDRFDQARFLKAAGAEQNCLPYIAHGEVRRPTGGHGPLKKAQWLGEK